MDKLEIILRRERRLKLIAFLAILFSLIFTIMVVENMLVSFVLAFVIYYLLAPIVNHLERRGLPRQLAVLIPFAVTGLLIGIGIYLVLPLISAQFTTLEASFPQYQRDFVNLLATTEMRLKTFFALYQINASETVNSWLVAKTTEWSAFVPSLVTKSLQVLLLAPFFAYFMLQDGRKVSRTMLSLVPNNVFELVLHLQHQINEQMGGFIRARFLEAAIVGLVVWIGLMIIGFPYATILAIFAALTNLIPYIGPIIGAVPAVVIALISNEGRVLDPMSLNLVVITSIYFIAQLIDILFIIPLVVAKIVNLHPVTVIVVIIIGAQIMGILGMVISIPVASVLKVTLSAIYVHLTEFRSPS